MSTSVSESNNSSKLCNMSISSKLNNIDVTIFLGNSCFEIPEFIHIEAGDKVIVIDYISSVTVLTCRSCGFPNISENTRRKFVVTTNIKNVGEITELTKELQYEEMIKIVEEVCKYQMVPDRTIKSIIYLENNGSNHQLEFIT